MNELEEQAQALVRVLFETMVELRMFMLKCSEDPEDTIRRVLDSMILQKVRQAKASGWAGFGLFGLDPKELLGDEAEIKTRYTGQDVDAMRNHGFSGLNLRVRADKVGVSEAYNIIYQNFSRNVHSTDYVEHIRMLKQKHENNWPHYEELRDAVGLSAAATFLFEIAHTATIIQPQDTLPTILLLTKLDPMAAKFRRIGSWVDLGPVADDIKALDQTLSGVMLNQ
jgi:hypothetical protein